MKKTVLLNTTAILFDILFWTFFLSDIFPFHDI
jgi:hypothetical protein